MFGEKNFSGWWVSNILYVHPENRENRSNLTNIYFLKQVVGSTTPNFRSAPMPSSASPNSSLVRRRERLHHLGRFFTIPGSFRLAHPAAAKPCGTGLPQGVRPKGRGLIFNRRYIFKWLFFRCHVSFWGCNVTKFTSGFF